eukprot:gene4381-8724_t
MDHSKAKDEFQTLSLPKQLRHVLHGAFEKAKFLSIPKRKLSIFLSSAVTDTNEERRLFLESILPTLQKRGYEHGILVTISDMRHGTNDEHTLDHSTWISSSKELIRCHTESGGLFFISLQGSKYGYMPIPKHVTQNSFENRTEHISSKDLEDVQHKWYALNSNQIPPRYVLKNLITKDDKDSWDEAIVMLRHILRDLLFDEINGDDLHVGRSISEWEIKLALRLNSSKCLWLYRQFSTEISLLQDPLKNLSDCQDASTKMKLQNLLSILESSLLVQNISKLPPIEVESYIKKDTKFIEYLQSYEKLIMKRLQDELDEIIFKKDNWDLKNKEYGIKRRTDLIEFLHHINLVNDYSQNFQGRNELIHNILFRIEKGNIIISQSDNDDNNNDDKDNNPDSLTYDNSSESADEDDIIGSYYGISLFITGIPGTGKTALLSKIAFEISKKLIYPVIVRYCASSRDSMDGLSLIRSISSQIRSTFNEEYDKDKDTTTTSTTTSTNNNGNTNDIHTDYNTAIKDFHNLLQKHAIILFIVNIDFLLNSFEERSRLSFLINIKPHKDSRIILSMSTYNNNDNESNSSSMGLLQHHSKAYNLLLEAGVPQVEVGIFDEERLEDAKIILQKLLLNKSTVLTPGQLEYVMLKIAVEPTIFYVKLAARVTSTWNSYDVVEVDVRLESSMKGIINQIFDLLERQFGVHLTRFALGFITLCCYGLNDIEMQDLLSLCDEVLEEIYQKQHHPDDGKYRVPFHYWVKLRTEMSDLLLEWDSDHWLWSHQLLRETALERYSSQEMIRFHQVVGRYFGDIIDPVIRFERLINHQPLTLTATPIWFENSLINERRCLYALPNLIAGGLMEEAAREICSLEVICACICTGKGLQLVSTINKLWLTKDISNMLTDTRLAVIISASNQPLESIIKQNIMKTLNLLNITDINNHLFQVNNNDTTSTTNTTSTTSNSNDAKPIQLISNFSSLHNGCKRGIRFGGLTEFSPLLFEFKGHNGYITSTSFNFNGTRIISASHDKTIKIWNVISNGIHCTLEGHSDWITSVSFSPDGNKAVSGSDDASIKIWDVNTGEIIHTIMGHSGAVTSVSFSSNGQFILSTSSDCSIRLWNVLTGHEESFLEGHTECILCAIYSPNNNNRIASGSEDKLIKLWNVITSAATTTTTTTTITLQHEMTLEGHNVPVLCLAFSSDGNMLISGSEDQQIRIWNVLDGMFSLLTLLEGCHDVSGGGDKLIKVWDISSGGGVCIHTLEGHVGPVTAISFRPHTEQEQQQQLVSASGDKNIKIWDLKSNLHESVIEGHIGAVTGLAVTYQGSRLASGSTDQNIIFWDTNTGNIISKRKNQDKITSLAFNSDNSMLAVASEDKFIRIYDVSLGTILNTFEDSKCRRISSILFSSDNSKLISATHDKNIKIWNIASGTIENVLSGHTNYVNCIHMSSPCTTTSTTSATTTNTSSNNQLVSCSDDETVKIWDLTTGNLLFTYKGHNGFVYAVSLHPHGTTVASGGMDKAIHIWNSRDGSLECSFEGHVDYISSLSFNSNGSKIVSGSADTTIRLWDVLNKTLLHVFEGHMSPITSVIFTIDDSRIFSGSKDKTVISWDVVEMKEHSWTRFTTSPLFCATYTLLNSTVIAPSHRLPDVLPDVPCFPVCCRRSASFSVSRLSSGYLHTPTWQRVDLFASLLGFPPAHVLLLHVLCHFEGARRRLYPDAPCCCPAGQFVPCADSRSLLKLSTCQCMEMLLKRINGSSRCYWRALILILVRRLVDRGLHHILRASNALLALFRDSVITSGLLSPLVGHLSTPLSYMGTAVGVAPSVDPKMFCSSFRLCGLTILSSQSAEAGAPMTYSIVSIDHEGLNDLTVSIKKRTQRGRHE